LAKPKKKNQQQSKSASFLLLILIVVLAIVAGLFFKDYRQVPYGWIISVIWLMAGFFALGFGILYFAQFILPHHEGESWIEGVNMLLRSATHSGPRPKRSLKAAEYPGQENLPPSFDSLKAGILRSYQVLAINRGSPFTRPAGPGFVRLAGGESVGQVLDLRKHVRAQEVTTNTRDGIPLITSVKIVFRIKQPGQVPDDGRLEFPYDQTAIFQVSQASSVDEHNELLPWTEQLAPQAASYLVSEVAQFTLNELSQEPNLLNGIQRRVRRQLRSNFDGMGIKIFDVSVTMQDLPDEIVQQRLANWRAPWESEIRVQVAASDANTLRRMKRARAHAQVEIIQKIMKNIDEMRRTESAALPQVINLRVIEALDEAISSSSLQTHIPGQVLADMALETSSLLHSPSAPPVEDEENDG
jgi:hypothetical protein